MPYFVDFYEKLPPKPKPTAKGAPAGIKRVKPQLQKRPGMWARVSSEASFLSAKLVAAYWDEKDSQLEVKDVGRHVFARVPPDQRVTEAQARTEPGASVRPPEVEKVEIQTSKRDSLPNLALTRTLMEIDPDLTDTEALIVLRDEEHVAEKEIERLRATC